MACLIEEINEDFDCSYADEDNTIVRLSPFLQIYSKNSLTLRLSNIINPPYSKSNDVFTMDIMEEGTYSAIYFKDNV